MDAVAAESLKGLQDAGMPVTAAAPTLPAAACAPAALPSSEFS